MPSSIYRLLHTFPSLLFPLAVAAASSGSQPSVEELSQPRELAEAAFGLPGTQPRLFVLQHGDAGHINLNLSYEDTPLNVGGQPCAHGLGVHAPCDLLVHLPVAAVRFRATVGVDRNAKTAEEIGGRLVFSVEADGKTLWTSAAIGRDAPPVIADVSVAGLKEFHLKVRSDSNSNRRAHADWGEARLEFADGRSTRLDEIANRSYLITQLPLSFVLGGESSRTFLDRWPREISSTAKADRIEHTLRWRKPDGTFEVRCELIAFLTHPAVEWKLHFKNTGSVNSPTLEKVLPLDATIARHCLLSKNSVRELRPMVYAFAGSNNSNTDFSPLPRTVTREVPVQLATVSGRSSDPYLPFWNFDYGGYGFITALGWSGDWQMETRRVDSEHSGMRAGMSHLSLYLQPGEEISSPSVCLLFWESADPLRGHNLFRRYMRECIAPTWAGGQKPEVYAMAGGSSALETVNETNQLDFIRKIAGTGATTYWLDAGWYQGPEGADWTKGRGNWFPDKKKFPHGMRPLGDEAHQLGLKFLLWFDPECVQPGTQVATEHPEWILHQDGERFGLFNLGDRAARKYLTELIAADLVAWDVDVFRNDYNVDPREYWRRADPAGRTGITELRYIEGLYAFWDGLRAAKPGLLIDNCASGGRRIDYETSKRSVPLWRSDYQCDLQPDTFEAAQSHTYGLSYFLPYHGTGQGMSFLPYKDRSLVSPCVQLGIGTPSADALADVPHDKVKKVWDDVKAFAPLMAYDYYPLTDFSSNDTVWQALQYDHAEAGEGCLIAFSRPHAPYVAAEFRLQAIDPQASYRLTTLNTGEQRVVSGAALRALPVALQPGESTVIKYKKL